MSGSGPAYTNLRADKRDKHDISKIEDDCQTVLNDPLASPSSIAKPLTRRNRQPDAHFVKMPRDVETTLNYYTGTSDGDAPYHYISSPPPDRPRTNVEIASVPSVVHDVRGKEGQVGLDLTGFAFVQSPSKEKLFEDDKAIKEGYYKEVEELVKREVKDAKRVFIFDHTIRSVCHHHYGRYDLMRSVIDARRQRSPLRTRIRCGDQW